jgi:phosphohistidine swiveling domain-containing protein
MILYQAKNTSEFTIGGKAKGLFRLQNAGVTVPEFLVIPAETFDGFLAQNHSVLPEILRNKLEQFSLPEQDQEKIKTILKSWKFPEQPVVVRSSIADEDGEADAFPGMMDSFLNLTDFESIFTAVAACAASAFSERAVAYRNQKNLPQQARPAVIIQKQIMPEASGVMFTTFPEYPQETAIHAVWGFGEGLVGGLLEADEFYFLKKNGTLNRQKTASKEIQLTAKKGNGLKQVSVPSEKQEMPSLSPSQLSELYQLGNQLEASFGKPLDIEFVVSGGQVFLVQARPVTQAIPEVIVYDNSNIQESYCGVTTPLTFSFALRAYATVYRQTMQVLGLPEKTIREKEPVVTQLLGLVKGRIYYNINNWYRGLQLLPSFRQNKADMERMMGLEEPVDFVEDREKTLLEKLKMLPGGMVNLSRLLWAFYRQPKLVPAFHEHFRKHYQQFYLQPLSGLNSAELLARRALLDKELLQNWTTPIINDFYVMMTNGKVARKLKKAGISDTDEFLSRYLSGDQQIESTQPTKALQQLAQQAWAKPKLRQLILGIPEDLHAQIETNFPAFFENVQQFINQYGDRTVGELKLETRTMRIEPLIFYKYLRNYLTAEEPVNLNPAPVSHLHESAVTELTGLLKNRSAYFGKTVWKSLDKLQHSIRYRESLRLERTRLFGMYRALYLAMVEHLFQAKKLQLARDVFYLSETEILSALSEENASEIDTIIQERKAEFEAYKKEDVASRVIIPSPPQEVEIPLNENPDELHGSGCYPGMVRGEIILVTSPESDLNISGKIVCALRTDPGWAALFPMCKGVLIEKGSSLSHSVILLRELGIPTIINIPGLTKTLQTGQQISMNGSTGEIKILKPDSHETNAL